MVFPAHWVNGEVGDTLALVDRGFSYGDGLFETPRYARHEFHLLDYHLQRLQRGCQILDIGWQPARIAAQLQQARDYLCSARADEATLRLAVSRGAGGRGYGADADEPTIALSAFAPALRWREKPQSLRLITCDIRLSEQPLLAGIKHANRLENVLAARQVRRLKADEGLLRNGRGEVVCATAANLFARIDGCWMTPPIAGCGIEGVVRRHLLEHTLPVMNWPISVRPLLLAELDKAEEIFLTNSLIGVNPVQQLSAGPSLPDTLSLQLRAVFMDQMEQTCAAG
jgi:4-amino-4-deoxychorismate lyase